VGVKFTTRTLHVQTLSKPQIDRSDVLAWHKAKLK